MPYPPGTSAGDPRAPWNEPHAHEHEFRPYQDQNPVIEDGAAIFSEECIYAEGEYGQGYSCEESRSWRMEVSWAEKKLDGEPNIIYLASEFDHFPLVAERALIGVESGGGEVTNIDPDKDYGSVTVETDEWRVRFKAEEQPQIEPHRIY